MGPLTPELIQIGALRINFIASREQTDGHADVYEVTIPAGAKVPGAHYHIEVDEVLTGLEGVVTYVIGEQVVEIGPGRHAYSPKGVVHYFENRGTETARFLVTATPGVMGPEYFRAIAAVVAAGGPPDVEKIKTVMGQYGLVPAPLPAAVAAR
jgi:mannose-6-phosphate isomerase-like protein (cupin superfamily)